MQYNVCKHVVAKAVITQQLGNSSYGQTTVNKTGIIKKKNSRHVIYSAKIIAFHCHFDSYYLYTKHFIDMHEVSFPLAGITFMF